MASAQEYLTGNRRIRFPFADDSVIPGVDSDTELAVFGCFVDAMVQVKQDEDSKGSVPVITGISVLGNSVVFRVKRDGDAGQGTQITCAVADTRFPVVSGSNGWCWYTFVMSSDGILELSERYPLGPSVSSAELRLSDSCVGEFPPGVTTMKIYGGKEINPDTGKRYTRLEALAADKYDSIVSGDVKVKTGYNMTFLGGFQILSGATGENSPGHGSIVMRAIPGAGEGRLPCDCSDAIKYNMPGLLSSDGHTRWFNDTCYDTLPILFSRQYGELTMHMKCKACCTCEMYADILENRLVPLKDAVLENKESLDKTLDTYVKYVDLWNERIAKAQPEDIVISCTGVPLDAAATDIKDDEADVNGTMSRCGFSVTVRNESFVKVTVEFSDFESNGDPFETQISFMDENLSPRIEKVKLPTSTGTVNLPPGRSATLSLFVRLPELVKTDEQSGFMMSIKVTAKQGDRVIVSETKTMSI